MAHQSNTPTPGLGIKSKGILPLIRLISSPISKLAIRLPITPNFVTTLSLFVGLFACILIAFSNYYTTLIGSTFFLIYYILDNVDGDVAREKNLCTPFGDKFDTFVDWIIHSCLFVSLGWNVSEEFGVNFWLWFGISGSAGGTINYIINLFGEKNIGPNKTQKLSPKSLPQWLTYILRELFRADFCFILIILAALDYIYILLPLVAIGAHIYWLTSFVKNANKFHV